MKSSSRHAEDEAIKARERAARSVTTVVPNLASMLQDDVNQGPNGNVQGQEYKVPAKLPGAVATAAMPPPPVLQSSISREEADRQLKEREKQRAPRIAVVPNLADIVQDGAASSDHFSPVGQNKPKVAKMPATAAIPPPLATSRSAPVAKSTLSQQEQDEITKQRERNARAAAVVPNLANRMGSIGRPQVDGPEPPVLQGAVSAPSTTTSSSMSTSRSTASSTEDRDNQVKQQEKRLRATNRLMMTNAQRLSQQEQDVLAKERERQSAQWTLAAPTTTGPKGMGGDGGSGNENGRLSSAGGAQAKSLSSPDSEDLLQARFEAATLAMAGNLTQDDKDQLLKERQRQTTYQTHSDQQEKPNSVPEQGASAVGRREIPNSTANRAAPTNTARRGIAPGALAVTDGIAQELNKAVLTHVEPTSAPEYVVPVSRKSDTAGTDTMDAMEGQRAQGTYTTVLPIESEPVFEPQSVVAKTIEPEMPSRRKWYMIGAVVLIVIVAIAVGVAVAAGGKSDETTESSGTPSSTAVVETERRIALRDALVASGVSSTEQSTDPTEAQFQALTWLADADTATDIEDTLAVTQRYALAVFYYSMNGPDWTGSSNWLDPSTNVCEWTGITCIAGEVAAIKELNPINMEGELPTELDALSSLESLVIEKNTVRGFVGPINTLIELSLNEAQLGELFKDIPTTILEMTNLQRLYLKSNGLIGTIPTEIAKLTSLSILDVSDNMLSGTLPTELHAVTGLTELTVFRNQFGGDVFKIMEGIPNLRAFIASENRFTGTIGTGIAELSNLQRFEIRDNGLTGPISSSIFNLTSLGILDLGANQLTGTLSTMIGQLENLADLYLTGNRISGSIPTEIGRVPYLRRLQLERCGMSGAIPTEVGLLSQMAFLQLSSNNFEGPIPTELGNLVALQTLSLDSNSLTGPIPTQLGQLTLLTTELRLVDNELTGTLPSEVCAIPTLPTIILVGGFPRDGLSCGDCPKCS